MNAPPQCPVCRAAVEQGPNCRRCKADLSLWLAVGRRRAALLAAARRSARDGDLAGALVGAREADSLHRGDDSLRLLAALHLLKRDFAAARRLHRAAEGR
jgi:hypothetical protein